MPPLLLLLLLAVGAILENASAQRRPCSKSQLSKAGGAITPPQGSCHDNPVEPVLDGQTCTYSCGHVNGLWSHYLCRDGRWFADTVNGQMCEQFATAGCVYNGTAVVCDRCGREAAITTPLLSVPEALPASVRTVIVKCHNVTALYVVRMDTYADVTHLDVSKNQITELSRLALVWTPRLEHLNLSENRISQLLHSYLTSAGRMRALDLSHNRIASIEPYALRSNLDPGCSVAVDFRFEGNPCGCTLQQRVPGSALCNDIVCDCTEVETETVMCGSSLDGNGTDVVLASQVCDGTVHCGNCWDENICDIEIDTLVGLLEPCFGPRTKLSLLRGALYAEPGQADFVQRNCFGVRSSMVALRMQLFLRNVTWRETPGMRLEDIDDIQFSISLSPLHTVLFSGIIEDSSGKGYFSGIGEHPPTLGCMRAVSGPDSSATTLRTETVALVAGVAAGLVLSSLLMVAVVRKTRRPTRLASDVRTSLTMLVHEAATQLASRLGGSSRVSMPTCIPPPALVMTGDLGAGAFGVVSRALWRPSKEDPAGNMDDGGDSLTARATGALGVAVKRLELSGAMTSEEARGFLMEACLLHALRHEHIVSLLAVVDSWQPLMLVLELAEGGDLRSFVKRTPLHGVQVVHVGVQVASARAFLHRGGVVHRDVAARNVLVFAMEENPHVKLSDFGLGRLMSGCDDYYRAQTMEKQPFRWMAPESLAALKYSAGSDMWSFGVMLWEAVSGGEMPYGRAAGAEEVYLMLQLGSRLQVPQTCTNRQLRMVMEGCWSGDVRARPSAASAELRLRQALQVAVAATASIQNVFALNLPGYAANSGVVEVEAGGAFLEDDDLDGETRL